MSDTVKRLNAALEGRYSIERELGEGGMATVYLADDLRHERKVALKVLKPELAAVVGAERFLAEIKTTANLQHPQILPLHDSGEAGGLLFYVMPYVRGESLRDRLDREHQLPVDEAVGIAAAVAGALDYAHQHGVVHRDIKPGNILMQAGQPVVCDFGIALAVGAVGGARITETGLSVGTPYYMSPEQATGDDVVGAQSDLYALGCVLYEMLTGEPPYTGKTAQAVLGQIIQGVPVSATAVRSSVPPNVDAAIRKALEKLPADRFPAARDFAAALADPSFRHGEAAEAVPGGTAAMWRRTASALAALLALVLGWTVLRPTPAPPVARYGIEFAPGQEPIDVLLPTLALAPDGSAIVYVGPGGDAGQLWLKPRDRFEAMPLEGTDGARSPSVSPDGTTIMYQAGTQLRRIPVLGGASVTMADSVNTVGNMPVAWFDDGTVIYVDSSWRFRRMPAEGGPAEVVWTRPRGRYAVFPKALPGSEGLLFTLCNTWCTEFFEIWALDLETGEARSLVPGAVMAEYTPTGHLLYVRPDGSVFAQAFDPGSLEVEGAAVPVLEGVKVDEGAAPDLTLSPDGTLLMRTSATVSRELEFVWVTREGLATPVHPGWSFQAARANRGWSLSPDGTMLATGIWTDAGYDIWVKELPQGPLSRLTFYEGGDERPGWSPDGSRVTFISSRGGVWSARPDGVGEPTLVYDHDVALAEAFWTPDGEWLVLRTAGPGGAIGDRDILAIRPGTDSIPVELMAADFDESAPAVSPDSRWIAYRSSETGRDEVFVRPFPDVDGGKWQVSTEGGTSPLWAHSGRELFYVSPDRELVAAQIESDQTFRVGERRVLFRLDEGYVLPGTSAGLYDIAPDDERFLFVRQAGSGGENVTRTILVENWFEELRAAVGR